MPRRQLSVRARALIESTCAEAWGTAWLRIKNGDSLDSEGGRKALECVAVAAMTESLSLVDTAMKAMDAAQAKEAEARKMLTVTRKELKQYKTCRICHKHKHIAIANDDL